MKRTTVRPSSPGIRAPLPGLAVRGWLVLDGSEQNAWLLEEAESWGQALQGAVSCFPVWTTTKVCPRFAPGVFESTTGTRGSTPPGVHSRPFL